MAGLNNTRRQGLPTPEEARQIVEANNRDYLLRNTETGDMMPMHLATKDMREYFGRPTQADPLPSAKVAAQPSVGLTQAKMGKAVVGVPDTRRDLVRFGMDNLIKDFGLPPHQAAAVMGNLALESDWFNTLEERPSKYTKKTGQRGLGWAQWTNSKWEPRRTLFEQYAKTNKLDPYSNEANYGYLSTELRSNPAYLKALRTGNDVKSATERFMNTYERPKAEVAHLDRRQQRAAAILDFYNQYSPAPPQQMVASNP